LDKKNSEINLLKKIGNYYKLRYGRSIMFGDFSYTILKFGEFLKLWRQVEIFLKFFPRFSLQVVAFMETVFFFKKKEPKWGRDMETLINNNDKK